MTEIFADSSYWIALLNPKDALHEKARNYPCSDRLVSTLAVQLEVMDAFSSPPFRQFASLFWKMTSNNADITVVELSADLMKRAMDLFDHRPDKSWTLTDCVSFVVMHERKLTDALTHDHHFEQVGFRALLRNV
jgi:uncharacterized protein